MITAFFRFTCAVIALTGCWASAQEVDPDFDPFDPESTHLPQSHWPKQIAIDYTAYDVPLGLAEEMIASEKVDGRSDKIHQKLRTLSKGKEVTLVDLATVSARPGETATIESVTEIIYPTEYEPPVLPNGKNPPESPEEKALRKSQFTPAAFETRNVGLTLEFEPSLDDNEGIIDIRIAPEFVELIEFRSVGTWENEDNKKSILLPMPTFYSQRLNSSQTIASGHSALIGITTPLDENKKPSKTHRRFHFIKPQIEAIKPTGQP